MKYFEDLPNNCKSISLEHNVKIFEWLLSYIITIEELEKKNIHD